VKERGKQSNMVVFYLDRREVKLQDKTGTEFQHGIFSLELIWLAARNSFARS
jgi:hypothetical protein